MLIIYRDQERLDARTAMVIANSLRTQPMRWSVDFIHLVRDDGFKFVALAPYEKRFTLPRWIDKDTYGRQRLVVPPKLAAITLRSEVRRWWKKYGPELGFENPVKPELPLAA